MYQHIAVTLHYDTPTQDGAATPRRRGQRQEHRAMGRVAAPVARPTSLLLLGAKQGEIGDDRVTQGALQPLGIATRG